MRTTLAAPRSNDLAKEPVRLPNRVPGIRLHARLPGTRQHRPEGGLVGVSRPDLKTLIAARQILVIANEPGQQTGLPLRACLLRFLGSRDQQKLKRGEPLLPVNDEPTRGLTRSSVLLIEYHSTQEMRRRRLGGVSTIEYITNVLPERPPMPLLLPNVRPLISGTTYRTSAPNRSESV